MGGQFLRHTHTWYMCSGMQHAMIIHLQGYIMFMQYTGTLTMFLSGLIW